MNVELLRKILSNKEASSDATKEARDITLRAFRQSRIIIAKLDKAEKRP